MNSKNLKGKIAVVTGGAIGIGFAIAKKLAQHGAQVIIGDINSQAEAAEKLRSLGLLVRGEELDVSKEDDWKRLAELLEKTYGGVDILVNNAGLCASLTRGPFEKLPNDEWRRVMDVNVFSIFIGAKALVPLMRSRGGGRIVNMSSASVYKGLANVMHYTTSKGAITMMTQVMARELGADDICVNSVAPGFTLSEGMLARKVPIDAQRRANTEARALKRDQLPDDVVGAVWFLCSAESSFITGQALVVDGGIVFH